jgi:membrane fusion protein, heavy metal efflux system
MSRFHSFSLAVSHGGASLLDFLGRQGEYRTMRLAGVNLVGSCLHFSSSRAAGLVQLADSCGAAAVPPGAAPKISAACIRQRAAFLLCLALLAVPVACSNDTKAAPTKQEITVDPNLLTVDHPERFPTVKVESRDLPTELHANGTVQPDVSKTIHVTSLGSGRVVDLKVRLGDYVNKGQILLVISSPDVAGALGDYHKASADEELARKALDRAQLLYSHGAFAEKELEAAENAAAKAKSDQVTAENRLRVIGGDPAHPSNLIELRAPVSGTIVEQNVAGFEGIKSLDNTPNLFTIADLSDVWVVCDVYENDLGDVNIGDPAEVRLNAFPDRVFKGNVSNISRVLDPNTRSAKVRIVLANSGGAFRPGMYAAATFRSRQPKSRLVVAATAVMRLQDKDWVFRKETANSFRRLEVQTSGLSGGLQTIQQGAKAGDELVANALAFSAGASEQGK